MYLLLDENVAASVADAFREAGHTVGWVRDIVAAGSEDPLVAKTSELEGAILVSHDRDFRKIAPRIPQGNQGRFRRLSRISFECSEPQAASRARDLMDYIELAWAKAQKRADKRMIVAVGKGGIRVDQ